MKSKDADIVIEELQRQMGLPKKALAPNRDEGQRG
jgi:hypothetical protein